MRAWTLIVFSLTASWLAQAEPRLVLSKRFPHSNPAFAEVRIAGDGAVEYREDPAEEPLKVQLQPEEAREIFSLAEQCGRFTRQLESGLPVARMGQKSFTWSDGAVSHMVEFNYTEDASARALLDWYERIVESERAYYDLERMAKYEPLGVNQSLMQLETIWDHKRLVAVRQFLPLLDRVANNERYLNMSRERAARLAVLFRGALEAKPAAAKAAATKAVQ
jgi:hypothetical protein